MCIIKSMNGHAQYLRYAVSETISQAAYKTTHIAFEQQSLETFFQIRSKTQRIAKSIHRHYDIESLIL